MRRAFLGKTEHSSATLRQQAMFHPSGSGWTERTGPFFHPETAPLVQASAISQPMVQRQPEGEGAKTEEEKNPLREGLKTVADQLKDDPKFKTFYEPKLDWLKEQLKLKLWKQQPPESKVALVSFIAANLGVAGAAFAASPEIRKLLSDVNIGEPLSWIPYSPIEGLKYKLPELGKSAYGFSGDFTLNPYLESARKHHPPDTRCHGRSGNGLRSIAARLLADGRQAWPGVAGGGAESRGQDLHRTQPPPHEDARFQGRPAAFDCDAKRAGNATHAYRPRLAGHGDGGPAQTIPRSGEEVLT